ncbi:hypothetical protein BC828DRAFT_180156 [Blastocladiella britannica]|nr:hypothetical protein BC828DRAFT_180156 [Blastocladiella britannica]
MGRSPPATSAAAAAIPGSPSLVRRGSSYGAVLNSVSQPPSALTPNFVVYLITAVVMVFMVFSIVIQANIGTGAATSTQSIPITWQRMFVTRQSAMFVTVSILIPFLLRVYGARRHRSMGTAKVWTPIVPALTFNVTMITCVIFEKTWAFAGLIFGFLMTQIAFVVVLVRVSSRAGGMSWLKQHLDLVHLFFFCWFLVCSFYGQRGSSLNTHIYTPALWVYYGIDRGYELFLKWTLQNNFATRGLIGNAVLRILTAVFMSINELAVELVFGRRDLWVVFPHRALDDMTIIALTLTSQAFGSTDAINIGQYGLVTALIAFGRDCFVTNDLWFALRFDLSLTDLYPSWTASDRDLLASPLLIASSTAAMKESGTAAAMSTNASESASNRSKRDLGDNRSRMSSLALQLPFPQWVKTLHAVAQNPLADEHLGSIVFDDILENNNDNRSFIVLANGGSGSGGGEMRTFMPLTTGAIPQGKQPTITANSSKSDVSLGIIKLDIMSSALLAAVSPPSAITGSGLAQGDALSNSIGGAAGTTDDRGSLGSDADLECARGSTAPPSSPKSRYLSSAPPSPDLTTSGLPQQGASMGVRNRSLSMPSRVANSSPPTATLKRVQESGKAATPPSSHSGGSTDSPTLSRRSGPRSTDHISVDYPSSTPPRRPSTRSSVLSAGTGGSATVESAEIVPSPLPVMLIAPVADDGHPPSDNSGAQSPIIRASVANGGGGGGFLKVQRRLSIVRSGSEIQDRDTPDHAIIQLPPTLLSQAVYSTSLSRGTGAVVGGGEGDLPVSAVNKRQSLESVGAAAATATNTSTTTTTTSVPPLRPRLASSGSVTGQSPLRETLRRNATLTRRAGLGTTTATPGPLPSTSVPSGTAPPVAALTTTTSIPPIPPRLVAWHAQLRSQVERLQHTLLARLVSMAAYAAVVGAEASLGVTALQTQVPLLAVIVGAGIGAALVAMGIVYLKVRGMRALVAAWSVSAALAGGFGGAAASRLPSVVVLDDEGSIRGTGTGGRAVAHSYSVPALLSSNVTGLHHAPGGGGWTAAMVAEQLRPIEFWNANLSTSISPRLVYIGIALVTFLRFGILSISWSAPALPTP